MPKHVFGEYRQRWRLALEALSDGLGGYSTTEESNADDADRNGSTRMGNFLRWNSSAFICFHRRHLRSILSRHISPSDRLIPKLLRHHYSSAAAVEDADADAPELRVEDVGAVAWGIHEAGVCEL